jgi:ferredoxin
LATITFLPGMLKVPCHEGESIYEVAWRSGAALSSACGAKATCGLCRVKIVSGEQHLGPLTEPDKKHLGNVYFITKIRLGCQARVVGDGDIVVEPVGAKGKKY